MPLPRTGYQLHFEDLSPGDPELGSVSNVPWDTETFGFPVAVYKIGNSILSDDGRKQFAAQFRRWASVNDILLCSCSIPVDETHSPWKRHLAEVGFQVVDLSLQSTLADLPKASLPRPRSVLRLAEPGDHSRIEEIAAQSFHHGRYHADALFPKALANKRYKLWVKNALSGENPIDRVYVMGDSRSVRGFFHVTVEGDSSDLRLAAVESRLKGTLFGFDLYVAVLASLKGAGVRKVMTSISAANTSVMNVYARLGFAFSAPEMIFHWHAKDFSADKADK